ncbi:MAG: hypothetical protein AABY04_03035, partial [Candidatus Micrarchaeota archaeon]
MSARDLGLWLARALSPSERDLSHEQTAREGAHLARELGAGERAFSGAMAGRAHEQHLILGHADDGTSYRLATGELGGIRLHLTGETGSGKTRVATNLADHVGARALAGDRVALKVADFKGGADGLADMTLRGHLGRIEQLPSRRQDDAFRKTLLFQPFGQRITPWQMLARTRSVSPLT